LLEGVEEMTTEQPQASTASMFRIKKVLEESEVPLNGRQIAKLANVTRSTFKNYAMPELVERGEMHQSGWEKYSYGHKPLYSIGKGETPPRPVDTRTNAERCKAYRANPGNSQFQKANRTLAKPDPIMDALRGIHR
jgi:hypothetical protein